jgi:hypothetical protein
MGHGVSPSYAGLASMQPDKHIPGSAINFGSGHTYVPTHRSSSVICKGAELTAAGTAGLLAIHLTGDADGVWYLLSLSAGDPPRGYVFDLVGDSTLGTTIADVTKVNLFPM